MDAPLSEAMLGLLGEAESDGVDGEGLDDEAAAVMREAEEEGRASGVLEATRSLFFGGDTDSENDWEPREKWNRCGEGDGSRWRRRASGWREGWCGFGGWDGPGWRPGASEWREDWWSDCNEWDGYDWRRA